MKPKSGIAVILCCLAIAFSAQVNAQGNNGRGKCMQPFGISFYAIKGGYEDEWLELYMKWHYPLPSGHGIEAQWTFAVSFLYPAAQDQRSAPLDRAQQIQKLFGDRMDEYVAGEKRRWELTESHWDTDFIELDKTEKPLSVYRPSAGGCQP
jgi:hypothetical protein